MIFRIITLLLLVLIGFYYGTVMIHATSRTLYKEENFFKLLIPFYGWYLLFKNK